jgi:two-component system, chemotaxis family, sensor kinase CheA
MQAWGQMALDTLKTQLEDLAGHVTIITCDDIDGMGRLLNLMDEMAAAAADLDTPDLVEMIALYKGYAAQVVMGEATDMTPLEDGVGFLRGAVQAMEDNQPLSGDMAAVRNLFGGEAREAVPEKTGAAPEAGRELSADDLEILSDFVSESSENIENIEIHLVELEEDPANKEIINDIFRPFHTIKGVSAFLELTKMNTLAHTTETFLDKARNGEFLINDVATDAILASVDIMKLLLARTREGVDRGRMPVDDDIDIDTITYQLVELPDQIASGESGKVGGILVRNRKIKKEDVSSALDKQRQHPGKPIGEIFVSDQLVDEADVKEALETQKTIKSKAGAQVKVSTAKLDDLVDLAGELVIAQSMLRQKAASDPALLNSLTQLGQIVTSMQNVAMAMRMVPIKATFMKMIRLVRDLSRRSGKKVKLEMSGEETEIDRNVVEALYDPMVHMIRNAVDHAIETEEDRVRAGKPAHGKIMLRAFHKGGNIVIEIEDDGKGLDREKIREKAISSGVVSPGETLTTQQVDQLIMAPGFSTASEITDISGRGVGMDVVKRGIEKLRGEVTIFSRPGEGCRFTIALPLTLAIIDGMLVRIGTEKYIIPTLAVSRSFRPERASCSTVKAKGEMIRDGDSLIPLIRMTRFADIKNEFENPWQGLVVVLESNDEKRGFLVDELLGRDEYVIKNLGYSLEHIKGISGGAILGDGTVGLILDVQGIFSLFSD